MCKPLWLVLSMVLSAHAQASSLQQSATIEKSIIKEAKQSQNVVTNSADNTLQLQNEIDALEAEIANLAVYERHLSALVDSQQQELAGLNSQLDEITETRQSIIPLMYDMLDGLAVYIEQDMPIRHQDRLQRLQGLQTLMTESGVSDAEKYRRILEAYQIELDYVNKLGTYTGRLEVDGATRQVELLYLGNTSFIARSIDAEHYWLWNQQQKQWDAIAVESNEQLADAYLVANKTAIPNMLMLPVSLHKEAK